MEEPSSSDSKKAKLDPDAMELDCSEASLISLTATGTFSHRDVVTRLRPIVLESRTYADSASLCSDLDKLEFLKLHSSISSEPQSKILEELIDIYVEVRRDEAANIPTSGEDISADDLVTAIEIRNSILYSKLASIDGESGMKIYNGRVADVQNPGGLTRVIIRPEDQRTWERSIELALDGRPVCSVGNPGVGKTSTTLFALQKLVIDHKAPVVYTIRKPAGERDIFYELVPVLEQHQVKDVAVTVYRIFANEKKSKIPSMQKDDAFYIVDPGIFEGSCNDTHQLYKARFIMAASNDDRHWGGTNFTKFRGPSSVNPRLQPSVVQKKGVLIYWRLWTDLQLIVAKPFIDVLRDVSDEELMRRLRIVGGFLRDIIEFDEATFITDVDSALDRLDSPTAQGLAKGSYTFAFDKTSPSSVLVGISPRDEALNTFKITLKSDYVEESLAKSFLKTAWYEVLDENNAGNVGNLFESYVRLKFSQEEYDFDGEEARESLRDKPAAGKKNAKKNYQGVKTAMKIGSKRTVVRVPNMIASVCADQTQEKMYYSKNDSEPLVDMIFRVDDGYNAIQSTIAEKHDAEAAKIRQLKAELKLEDDEKLRIFYAVPWCRYKSFETKPVNPLLDQPDLLNVFIYHVGMSAND